MGPPEPLESQDTKPEVKWRKRLIVYLDSQTWKEGAGTTHPSNFDLEETHEQRNENEWTFLLRPSLPNKGDVPYLPTSDVVV